MKFPLNTIPCHMCGNPISFRAKTCPHCGEPDAGHRSERYLEETFEKLVAGNKSSKNYFLITLLIVFLGGGAVLASLSLLFSFPTIPVKLIEFLRNLL